MFRRSCVVILALTAALVSGCGSQQIAQSGSSPQNLTTPLVRSLKTGLFCGGTNGYSVEPCPIKLTKKTLKTGILVTIHGPGPIWNIIPSACSNGPGYVCVPSWVGQSDRAQVKVCSGDDIGKAELSLYVYYYSYQYLGTAHLKVINEVPRGAEAYCT
jgi:hypothetical protein